MTWRLVFKHAGSEWAVPVRRIAEHKAAAQQKTVQEIMTEFRGNPALVVAWAASVAFDEIRDNLSVEKRKDPREDGWRGPLELRGDPPNSP